MPLMTCEEVRSAAFEFFEGAMPSMQLHDYEQHLSGCPACRHWVETARRVVSLSPQVAAEALDAERTQRIWLQLQDGLEPQPGWWQRWWSSWQLWGSVFAAAAVLLVLGTVWNRTRPTSPPEPVTGAPITAGVVHRSGAVDLLVGRQRTRHSSQLAVSAGTMVKTDPHSSVEFALRSDQLSVGPRTRLRLSRLSTTAVLLTLHQGEVTVHADPTQKSRTLTVSAPFGAVRVTGTVFRVSTKPGSVAVLLGTVEVTRHDGSVIKVIAGHRWEVGFAAPTALAGAARARLATETAHKPWQREPKAFGWITVEAARALRLSFSIGGLHTGKTPLFLRWPVGTFSYRATLDGQQQEGRVIVKDNTVTELELDLREAPASSPAATRPQPQRRSRASVGRRRRPTPRPQVHAAALFAEAQRKRLAGDYPGAAGSYRKILTRFRRSKDAKAARIALGEIELDHLGAPLRALRHFERYLLHSPRGPLGQEASRGRLRALRELGRKRAEQVAIEQFLRTYPRALGAKKLKKRLEALSAVR